QLGEPRQVAYAFLRRYVERAPPYGRTCTERGKREVLLGGKASHDAALRVLVNVGYPFQPFRSCIREVASLVQDASAMNRVEEAREDPQGGGFAGSVSAGKLGNGAGAHVEGHGL